MKLFLCLLFSIAVPTMASAQTAGAVGADDAIVYVVSYIEIVPASEGAVVAMLRQYRDASRKEESNVRLELLQRIGHPGQFAIVEGWKGRKGFEAHGAAAHTKQFRDKLQPFSVTPFDERPHGALAIGSMPALRAAGATYVLTHADAAGNAAKDEAIVLLKQLADSSRKDEGNVSFEVLQQSSRLNHSTIVEVWKDQQAFERHRIAPHTRQFREKFHPLSGALYDERVYRALE